MAAVAFATMHYAAECITCTWSESCDTYDEAVLVAEEHDANRHAGATA